MIAQLNKTFCWAYPKTKNQEKLVYKMYNMQYMFFFLMILWPEAFIKADSTEMGRDIQKISLARSQTQDKCFKG